MADKNYEDVTVYGLDAEREAELLSKQAECTFIWSNSEGHPVGVIMNFVFRDGRFYPALAAAVRPGDPDAQAGFRRHLDSPRRLVLEVVPEGRIGFDSTQMWRDTPDAARK